MSVLPGLEVLMDEPSLLHGKRIGLVTNQSGVTRNLQHAVKLLHSGRGWKLTALFGPEHGVWGEAQDMDDPTVMLLATRDRPAGWQRTTQLDMDVAFEALSPPHW